MCTTPLPVEAQPSSHYKGPHIARTQLPAAENPDRLCIRTLHKELRKVGLHMWVISKKFLLVNGPFIHRSHSLIQVSTCNLMYLTTCLDRHLCIQKPMKQEHKKVRHTFYYMFTYSAITRRETEQPSKRNKGSVSNSATTVSWDGPTWSRN